MLALAATACSSTASSETVPAVPSPPASGPVVEAPSSVVALADDTPASATDPQHWRATGSLKSARMNHTATRLASGKVLFIGGETYARVMLASIEQYDPETGEFEHVADLPAPRSNHTATLLRSGKVLVAGGGPANDVGLPNGGAAVLASAVLYDPDTRTVAPTGSLSAPREFHAAFALSDGRVVIAGGADGSSIVRPLQGNQNVGQVGAALATSEIYDPTNGTWSAAASMATPRYAFAAARTADGRLLVAGGANQEARSFTSAEIFDPAANRWTPTGNLAHDRLFLALARLGDGTLLAIGGKRSNIAFLASAERFDAKKGTWSTAPSLPDATTIPTLTALGSGAAARVGGLTCVDSCEVLGNASIFDPSTGAWRAIDALATPRAGHTTTVLSNGELLVAGGYGNTGKELADAERARP